ncbi:hypothetical protein WG66_005734, partial [Moniliophthora roreri]
EVEWSGKSLEVGFNVLSSTPWTKEPRCDRNGPSAFNEIALMALAFSIQTSIKPLNGFDLRLPLLPHSFGDEAKHHDFELEAALAPRAILRG